jgi:hypothetical protein
VLIPSSNVKSGETHLNIAAYRNGNTLTSKCAGAGNRAAGKGGAGG